jgi:hypothetical protein
VLSLSPQSGSSLRALLMLPLAISFRKSMRSLGTTFYEIFLGFGVWKEMDFHCFSIASYLSSREGSSELEAELFLSLWALNSDLRCCSRVELRGECFSGVSNCRRKVELK